MRWTDVLAVMRQIMTVVFRPVQEVELCIEGRMKNHLFSPFRPAPSIHDLAAAAFQEWDSRLYSPQGANE